MRYKVENFIDKNRDNILIHAGDGTNIGSEKDIRDFVWWFQNIKGFDSKIFIAGNHDWGFQKKEPWLYNYINDENLSQSDCAYLEDSSFTIIDPNVQKPIKFYGSPWQPVFFNWAFNVQRDELHKYWEKIPLDVDVLITHGPAHGILDIPERDTVSQGCVSLAEHIVKIKPKIHICGHIHSGRNLVEKNGTIHINASICTESYRPINKPIVIDYDFQTNKWDLVDM